ncbi:hypothetical protein PPYR_06181 [Photinus pyralis]|uniref:Uncharacterized protein n=1 Tax=Photinus pyralis TaxID=7054 RepID=A0A5N4ASW9_PHOPY|nr:hypothetical protein PPYR_06181 [Photinus pyralis]
MPNTRASAAIDPEVTDAIDKAFKKHSDHLFEKVDEKFNQLHQSIGDINLNIQSLQSKINAQDKVILDQNKQLIQLSNELDNFNQHYRRTSLVLYGVPEATNEDSDKIILAVAQNNLKVALDINDLDRSHRLGKRQGDKPRPIIFKLVSYRIRQLLFTNKSKLKGTSMVLRENLTEKRRMVLSEAAKKYGSRRVWTLDGKIFISVGENQSAKKYCVTTMEELLSLAC